MLPAPVRTIGVSHPMKWLARGVGDFANSWPSSFAHGFVLMAAGIAIVAIGWHRPFLLAGALSGFLLVAPILTLGVYESSRRLAAGRTASLGASLAAWRRGRRTVLGFGLLLAVIGTAWVGYSALLIAALARAPVTGVEGFVRHWLSDTGTPLFVVWLASGGLLASVVFAAAAVSLPLIVDREIGLRPAILTSVAAVGNNPVPMALWATLIMLAALLALATVIGIAVIIPVLGHATWHAYRDLVDPSSLPPRGPSEHVPTDPGY